MLTIKLPYICEESDKNLIKEYQHQYSICLRTVYKYSKLGWSIKQIKEKLLSYNNIDLIIKNSWLMASLFYDVKSFVEKDKVIFGGNKNFLDRLHGKITKEEWKNKRLLPLCSIGDADKKCNRLFKIQEQAILFKPNRKTKIILNLLGLNKKRIKLLKQLEELQYFHSPLAISYKINQKYIFISFDETIFQKPIFIKKDRIMSIDMNPNYIGWSILDWENGEKYKIVTKGIISIKNLNDKHFNFKKEKLTSTDRKRIKLNNKRKFEVFEISKKLVSIAIHHHCEMFALEKLTIESSDKQKGKKFNSLCNNLWNREKLVQNLEKRCNLANIKIQQVLPEYSSIIGNIVYRNEKLPDMILSSLEISRRAYEYKKQYIDKTKERKKNIIFMDFTLRVKNLITKSMEEFGYFIEINEFKELFQFLKKNPKIRYRIPLDESVFRQKSLKFCSIIF